MPEEDNNNPPTETHVSEEQNKAPATSQPENSQEVTDSPAQPQPAVTDTTPVPQAAPAEVATTAAPTVNTNQTGTVELVWQWLTYGLWSWTLASLGVLLSSTLAYFISSDARDGDSSWLVYVIATALCLLPISFVIDRVYSKHEPEHKHGFAAVILVIHAVLAFLVSVGSLITAVVTLLSLATDTSGDSGTKTTVIVSALLIAILGALFFVRIVRPPKLEVISRKFSLIVSVIAAITVIAALAGPYAATIQAKSDRQIESGLYGLNSAIQDYARDNKKLPASLNDLKFDTYEDNAKALAKSGLVTYEAKAEVVPVGTPVDASRTSPYTGHNFRYELCTTYKKSRGSGTVRSSSSSTYASSYIDTYSHPAGHTCYQQSVYVSGSSTTINSKSLFD